MIHGIDYVSWPRLIPQTDIIHYKGPGFRSGEYGKGLPGPIARRLKLFYKTAKSPNGVVNNGRKGTHTEIEEIEMGEKKRVD